MLILLEIRSSWPKAAPAAEALPYRHSVTDGSRNGFVPARAERPMR
jgi:hypothetical protein